MQDSEELTLHAGDEEPGVQVCVKGPVVVEELVYAPGLEHAAPAAAASGVASNKTDAASKAPAARKRRRVSAADAAPTDGDPAPGELPAKPRYSCQHCDFTARKKYHITVHERKHTGEKPFPCAHCEYRGATRAHLEVHQRTHTGNRPKRVSLARCRGLLP